MPTAARLRVVRDRLLKLHKMLLDWERGQYEKAYGQVRSSGDMLQLVLGHEQFAWLRPYSGLIVRIDEWLVSDQPSRQDAEAFWESDYREHLLGLALRIVQQDFQPTTWQAFWEHVVKNKPARQVAEELGLTCGAVYAAKVRILARLRQELDGTMHD